MMQAEATESSLREGVEALAVKDTEKTAAVQEEEDNTGQQDTVMTDATEEDSATKDEKSNFKTHIKGDECPLLHI